ncbi:MAG: NHL repeat-containing protein [Thiogranum sp.]
MSFCLTVVTRLFLLLACFSLTGCATILGVLGVGKDTQTPQQRAAQCEAGEDKPLARWSSVSGTLLGQSGAGLRDRGSARVKLVSPVSVAAQSNFVFIADAGQQVIFRFDRGTQTIREFARIAGLNSRAQLYVDRALSVYLADPVASRVVQFDLDGRVVQTYQNATELPQPIAVVVDDSRAEILAGDGLSARVLVFNRGGGIARAIGAQVSGGVRFQSVAAMAIKEDQLYVVDRLMHQVHALSPAGVARYEFGAEELKQPGAIAADEHNRVYVADNADNTIKVFRGGRFETVVGASGDPAGLGFRQISGLWISDGLLYVADSAGASVEILQVVAPCP